MSDILTAWKKEGLVQVRLNRIEREERGGGRGNKCKKKEKGWQWCTRAASVLVHREQKHCVRELELVSSHTWRVQWGSRQTSVHLFLSPGVIWKRALAVSDEDFTALWFQEVATGEDLNVLSFLIELSVRRGGSSWLLPFTALPLPVQRLGYGPVWRRRASSHRWRAAAAEGRAEPVNTSMGAKQMKW